LAHSEGRRALRGNVLQWASCQELIVKSRNSAFIYEDLSLYPVCFSVLFHVLCTHWAHCNALTNCWWLQNKVWTGLRNVSACHSPITISSFQMIQL